MLKSVYKISKMDCASEETLIRMKLDPIVEIKKLEFDLSDRKLIVHHNDVTDLVTQKLDDLNLGSQLIESAVTLDDVQTNQTEINKRLLKQVLLINFWFFVIELITGFISNSMGLVADSLDMLADAFVYGMSLYVVSKNMIQKKRVAALSGYIQLTLALLGFIEVIRRYFAADEIPDYQIMIIISIFALIGNGLSLYLLQKSKSKEVHMKASMIFTSNDIIVNAGVIIAAILVLLLHSPLPDLIIGLIIFSFVLRGSIKILKLGKA